MKLCLEIIPQTVMLSLMWLLPLFSPNPLSRSGKLNGFDNRNHKSGDGFARNRGSDRLIMNGETS